MAFTLQLVKNCPNNMSKTFGCEFEVVYLLSMLWSGNNAIYILLSRNSTIHFGFRYSILLWFLDGIYTPVGEKLSKKYAQVIWLRIWICIFVQYAMKQQTRYILLLRNSAIHFGFRYSILLWFFDGIYTPVGEKLSKKYAQVIWLRIWICIFVQYAMKRQRRYILLSRNWAIHFGFRYST